MQIIRQQDLFDKALTESYIPLLVPNVRQVVWAKSEESFEWGDKSIKYPSVLITREDQTGFNFVWGVAVEDDSELKGCKIYPADFVYKLKVFVERGVEMISIRDYIRVLYNDNPYVKFPWFGDDDFKVGLRFVDLTMDEDRSNFDTRGACRAVSFYFQCRLLILQVLDLPIIEMVRIRQFMERASKTNYEIIYK